MAPQQRSDKDKRLNSILSFAKDVEEQLPAAVSKPEGLLFNDIHRHISTFPNTKTLGKSASSRCEETDSNGTSLWNLCTRLRRNFDSDGPQDIPLILVLTRVFAFFLLDCALESGKSTTTNVIRVMKIGIKAAKNCIERKELDIGLKALEKVAGFEMMLREAEVGPPEDKVIQERLIAEYYVLRTALAWRQDQLPVAEHMFKKSITAQHLFDPNTAESLADVLFEMGKDLLHRQQYQMAIKWLERSSEVINNQELDRLSMDASELRTSIMEASVKALLGLKDEAATDKARGLVDLLENEVGDKLIVLLLRLELLSAVTNGTFDSTAYSDILQRMIRTMGLTESNFKLVLYHIRRLNDKSPSLACKTIDDLLRLRVLQYGDDSWIEKTLITRLWMTIGQRYNEDAVVSLDTVFSSIAINMTKPLSSAVTLAAHTLLWKRIESNYTQGQYEAAEDWCRLAMHGIFESSGDLNMARLSRKLLLCTLARQDFTNARDIFGAMSDQAKNEPMTRFLMYKVAIRCNETSFAAECLQIISSPSTKDSSLLYACVLDGQQIGNRSQTVAALQHVLERYSINPVGVVHLPSLLRVTIKLTSSLFDGEKGPQPLLAFEDVERLCKLFEDGVVCMRRLDITGIKSSDAISLVAELDWFSKNSYNFAIKNISIWTPHQLLRMLVSCIALIDLYPTSISEQVSDDLSLRKLFCEFSASTALVALARGEDTIEIQLQHYLNLRKHVDSYDKLLLEKLDKLEEGPADDLLQKLAILIAFDFEAACQLKAWDDINEVVRRAETCKNSRVYEVMADCILSCKAPTMVLIHALKQIINGAWDLGVLDSTALAKYMRCLFQVALTDQPDIAEGLLDQVCSLAADCDKADVPYPAEELEWVATRAFNHGIDLFCHDEDEACGNWASKALHIAHFMPDGGALEKSLQSKLSELRLSES